VKRRSPKSLPTISFPSLYNSNSRTSSYWAAGTFKESREKIWMGLRFRGFLVQPTRASGTTVLTGGLERPYFGPPCDTASLMFMVLILH
jgi:hypothetical protein